MCDLVLHSFVPSAVVAEVMGAHSNLGFAQTNYEQMGQVEHEDGHHTVEAQVESSKCTAPCKR